MIDTETLRSKILDFAIRGKLTEQLPGDGSAQDLYTKIQEKKARLVKEGKIKKEKVLPEITEEEIPFEIPKNWKWVRLIDFSSIINGDRGKNYPAKSTLSKRGIPFISALNLNGHSVDTDENLLCLSEEQYNKLGSGKLQKGDIVICIRGSLGKHGKYPFEKGAIASSLVIARPIDTQSLDELGNYMMIWLDSILFFSEIDKYDGGSAQPNLSADNLKKFLIPLPPIEEQKRIIDKVDDILEKIDEIENLQAQYATNVEILKGKLIDVGIRGKLTKQLSEDGFVKEKIDSICPEINAIIEKEEQAFEIPDNWYWIKLGWVIDIERGGSPRPIKSYLTNDDNGINWIKIGDVEKDGKYITSTKEKIKPEGEKKSRRIYPGDFLLTNSMSFGRPYISKITGCVHDGWLILRNTKGLFDLDFLYLLLSSSYVYNQFCKKASGATVENLNIDKVSDAVIPLPPLSEQKRIAKEIDTLLNVMFRR